MVSAWVILQVAAVVAPSLGLPNWTMKAVLGILLVGFSVALFIGWRLDVRAAEAGKLPGKFHLMVWPAIALFLLGGVILVLTVGISADRAEKKPLVGTDPSVPAKSIAVLPFESSERNQIRYLLC